MTAIDFYNQLSPFYHLLFRDWEASINWHAAEIDDIIHKFFGGKVETILDVACGIGTQSLGLAQLGYKVIASDVSDKAIERARQEALARELNIDFSVTDMRQVYAYHQRQFDLVIACDNAVPHLLSDEEILLAFQEFYRCTRPGGGCLISVRDYDKEERTGVQVKPYGVRIVDETKYLIFQVWEFEGLIYDLSMYFVEDRGGTDCVSRVMRSKYYAVGTDKLVMLMAKAGFAQVERLENRLHQPVVIGRRVRD
ncbi:MAG: class I SAM-dependent methyltransferase [Anaerolineae bacterium]|nr:class I SAM-dependent methyltransferase [Anaerolineae bacterium]